jgi:hypothetical protein
MSLDPYELSTPRLMLRGEQLEATNSHKTIPADFNDEKLPFLYYFCSSSCRTIEAGCYIR